ncbi:MAG: penicillin-binding protein 2, partial [Bacteroidota bacterium]
MPSISQVRLHVFAIIILVCLLILVGRLWMLQLTGWVVYARAAAEGNSTSVTYSPAPRGIIFDRSGRVLAKNRPVWNVSISPAGFPHDEDQAEKLIGRLAGILKTPSPKLRAQIKALCAHKGQEALVLEDIGEDVPFEIVAQIEEQAMPGVGIIESAIRSYPYGSLAAHVLGYARGINDKQFQQVEALDYPVLKPSVAQTEEAELEDPLYSRDSVYGQSGIEKQYEIKLDIAPPLPILSGRRGRTIHEVDSALTPVRLIQQRPPVLGASVYLTLDVKAQQAAEDGLRAALYGHPNRTGAAVAVDVTDGSVLAMASLPGFNPNDWVKRIPAAQWKRMMDDPRTPLQNKATCGLYPPASTFKLISASAALDTLKLRPDKRFVCGGYIKEGPQRFDCWQHSGHGSLGLRGGLAESCDVYFYQTVRMAGVTSDDLSQYAREFGLGEETGLDLPEEVAGLVPDREWKQKTQHQPWWNGDSLNMVIGQGYTQATPLQMALVCATVANGGSLLEPHLLKRIVWPEHLGLPPQDIGRKVRRQVKVRPETLQMVREGMRLAVTGQGGTAGAVRSFPLPVAAKTGSAEHRKGRPAHAWFVAFAPYDKPKYAIAVFVSEGEHGGTTAGPVARRILDALYGYKTTA